MATVVPATASFHGLSYRHHRSWIGWDARECGEGSMTQRLVWPADLQRQEDGSILVSFPDIPEVQASCAGRLALGTGRAVRQRSCPQ